MRISFLGEIGVAVARHGRFSVLSALYQRQKLALRRFGHAIFFSAPVDAADTMARFFQKEVCSIAEVRISQTDIFQNQLYFRISWRMIAAVILQCPSGQSLTPKRH